MSVSKINLFAIAITSIAVSAVAQTGAAAPLKALIVTPTDRISGCDSGLKYATISKTYWCGDFVVNPDLAIINASAPTTQTLACASYVNQYGIPANYTNGNFTRVVETNIYNPTYNTVISVNISGCSAPVAACQAFDFAIPGSAFGWTSPEYDGSLGSQNCYVTEVHFPASTLDTAITLYSTASPGTYTLKCSSGANGVDWYGDTSKPRTCSGTFVPINLLGGF